ncbi:AGE family epimerase/isomerase [Flavihumibacter rivuli]|uniref:AGE family epimerase/isomerase n=1 Tax=Flavihumibacter rivuli TaxID=2838156 RepID=UPI001BDDED47|nr:AGE family epimerase/isomerase [Flavihumibacter rivuli]ULQ55774.1 AGE family epimerase/isomerase [Flavihumibacter rivuli]
MHIHNLLEFYKNQLLNDVVPFWSKFSLDKENGGFFTCLDNKGKVYDTDKFVWLQCRQVWTYAMLYNQVQKREEWLANALHGAEFLIKYGRDGEGNWYFSLDRSGKPLVQPYNIFSDCFATMAFAQLYKATENTEYRDIAVRTFENILSRRSSPKGHYNKQFPGTRPLKGFSLPMILCNLVLEMESLLNPSTIDSLIAEGIHEVMEVFYNKKYGLILENVLEDGNFSNSFEGRLVNPGHSLEAMWFIMDLAVRRHDMDLIEKAVEISLNTLEFGWDKEHGGIFYFLDIEGNPPQQLEWDQKLWWVHIEAIVCMIKAYSLTGDPRCKEWFIRLHHYSWDRFHDSSFGEWFGYLNRQGEVLINAKGGKWKGFFHVPRGLYQTWKTLNEIETRKHSLTTKFI